MKNQLHNLPKVTFIIPTLNAEKYLPLCLTAIKSQNYPRSKIEIIIADGGSKDNTLLIADKFKAKIIKNPEIIHEAGKSRASEIAKGNILFFTDSDNIIVGKNWIRKMTTPFTQNNQIMGYLPQTSPPPNSSGLNRYLGYLFTDPLTWFIYGKAANPKTYHLLYDPVFKTNDYSVFQFDKKDPPLFGLSQGVGTISSFKRESMGWNDDLLSGIKLINQKGLIAYVPNARVYHYHVNNLFDFLLKYRWRIRNNLSQKVKGMGLLKRELYFSRKRIIKKYLFIPYSLCIVLPLFDAIVFSIRNKDWVMLWHVPACFFLALEILYEYGIHSLGISLKLDKEYGK